MSFLILVAAVWFCLPLLEWVVVRYTSQWILVAIREVPSFWEIVGGAPILVNPEQPRGATQDFMYLDDSPRAFYGKDK